MATLNLAVQANGTFQWWNSFTGADEAWDTVNDSDNITHDSGVTTLRLVSFSEPTKAGRVSFAFLRMIEGYIPDSFLIRCAAKRTGLIGSSLK